MILFNTSYCIPLCVKNKNPYIQLAVEDLRQDFARISRNSVLPEYVNTECSYCIIIEENSSSVVDPMEDESFSIRISGDVIRISANTYLGTMWGIYTFSEKVLGIDPCYLFNDLPIKKRDFLEVDEFEISEHSVSFGFRGVFINDEDLLTGWKDGGGLRRIDYTYYGLTVSPDVMDMVVETVLRLRMNLVIPASFLDIDNPPEKLLADRVARRGIYLSQHHLEPLGLSHFTLENYCKKFGKAGEYSYIQNPELLEEAWRYYVKLWAQYDNVVWQVGLRGKADRPVWEEDTPTEEELRSYGAFIGGAIKKQQQIVLEETNGEARYFTSTLWMEGSSLMEKGYLDVGDNVCLVFSDNGPNQMFGNEYDRVPRSDQMKYGIYYHLQYFDIGPHLAPQTGWNKIYYNMERAYQKGDRSYFILNLSNVREFTFELGMCAKLLWNIDGVSKDDYLTEYCSKVYGTNAGQAKSLIEAYFDQMPQLDTQYLCNVYAQYFNYFYEEVCPGVKNFVLKEGLILNRGKRLIAGFRQPFNNRFYDRMYEELKRVEPIYAELSEKFAKLCAVLDEPAVLHTQVKWKLHCDTLRSIYRWFIQLYEAKKYFDDNDADGTKHSLKKACDILEQYLTARECAEYGIFKNWYRGDVKMNIKHCLAETKGIMGYC